MEKTNDVLIVGCGIMGASIAYNLVNDGFDGSIVVFEKDPTFEYSSTCLSIAGFRTQFATEISIKMALYGIDSFEKFEEEMAVEGEPPHIDLRQIGSLVVVNEQQLSILKEHNALQKKLGAPEELLTPEEIKETAPELNLEGIAGGVFGRRSGHLDPHGLLQGYIKKGRSLGIQYVYEEVTKIFKQGNKIKGVETAKGNRYAAPVVVLAVGPFAAEVGKLVGIDLPIEPLRRMNYTAITQEKFRPDFPIVNNQGNVYFRVEKAGDLTLTREKTDDKFGFDFSVDRSFFYNVIWPEIAERIPALDKLKLIKGWSGIYDLCIHDANQILGTHPEVEGIYLAVGFSGHGMQQSPAVGKGISELIRLGRYETLDLSRFRFERFAENDLAIEPGIQGVVHHTEYAESGH